MRRRIAVAAILLLLLLVHDAAAAAAPTGGDTLTAKQSRFGRILFGGRGYVLYAFTADTRNRSRCYGACAAAWPPMLMRERPRAGRGVSKRLLGVARRRDRRVQVTYAAKPLYYYVGDRRPGQILCQNVAEFGGDWLVVEPSGAYVR